MSQTTGSTSTPSKAARGSAGTGMTATTSGGDSALITSQGRTTISDGVVSKIAGIATREVDGVYALGGGAARAMGAVRERISGKNHSQGVSVEVGERQAAADVDIVVEYGRAISDVDDGVRRNVIRSVERMTGLEVTEVNVSVLDIHIPGEEDQQDDEQSQSEPRVR